MTAFHIVLNPHRDGKGNVVIGSVRELPNGKWTWNGLRQFDSQCAAETSAKRTLGNVRFEQILE